MKTTTTNQRRHLRWNLWTRIRNLRRTIWQIQTLAACGRGRVALAEQVIMTGQCIQRKWELLAMMARVKRLQPEVVVEIGTYRGGSLRCWASVCPSNTMFISIDLPWEVSGQANPANDIERIKELLKPGQSLHWLRMDSHRQDAKDELLRIIGGRMVDFVFIDGDHSYEGVKADFELYHGLVRQGGLIAFHDIVPSRQHPNHKVHVFWAELKKGSRMEELVDRSTQEEPWGGIGVVRV